MGQSGSTEKCEKIVWPIDSFDSVIENILGYGKAQFTSQIKYLFGYMKRRGALVIIIEKKYTDGDYLSDYANYYCRCHDDYPRKTTRLHFFEYKLNDEQFESILLEDDSAEKEKLSKAYLGFTVIKPLPETIVGRTCFAPYKEGTNSDGHLRYYPIWRNYKLSCYGLQLEVDSVAFQEQDAEVAACSTTAIWYVLHASPKRLTESEIPSPYDITSKAMHVAFNASNVENGSPHRRFPSPGLDLRQIAEYLRWGRYDSFVVGVVPSRKENDAIIPGGEARLTNDFLLAYLSSKTPLLIVGTLSTSNNQAKQPLAVKGLHAITIMGYSLDPDPDQSVNRRYPNQQVHWKFERVVNLYIHDDGVGPFAKYQWSDKSIQTDGATNTNSPWYLTNHLENGEPEERRFDPAYIIVPIRDKVRLSHSGIMEYIELACGWIYASTSHGMEPSNFVRLKSGEWSIELIEVNCLKANIMTTPTLKGERKSWCKASLPKYLWRVVFSIPQLGSSEYLPDWEILFDATALTQAIGLIGFLTHDNGDTLNGSMMRLFAQCLNHKSLSPSIKRHPANAHWKRAIDELLNSAQYG
ncbi:MAG: hypothetical protein WAT68_07900 [Candidatus Nitrotoga sp.]